MGFEPEPVDLIDRADSAASSGASDGEGVGLPFCASGGLGFRLHPPVAVTRERRYGRN